MITGYYRKHSQPDVKLSDVAKSGFFLCGIGIGVLVWLVDPFIDAILLHEGTIYQQLTEPTVIEIYFRTIVSTLIITFSFVGSLLLTRSNRVGMELRESEQSLAIAQQIGQIGSWDWNIQDGTLTWSDETYRQFGLEKGQIIPTYEIFESFIHPSDRDFVNSAVKQALDEDEPYSIEAQMVRADGTEWTMHAQGAAYRSDDGKLTRFIGIQQDITKRKQIEEELKNKSEKLEKLTNDLRDLSTQLSIEEERSRKRFAKVLHEQVGGNLATIKLSFKRILERSSLEEEKTKDTISDAISLLTHTMMSTRELTADLYPSILDDMGFIPAVKWYIEKIMRLNGINVSLEINDQVEGLTAEMKLPLFRVIQESFQNIIKHASATEVNIELIKLDNTIKLSVRDNGTGFDPEKINEKAGKGIGLRLIKERALSIGGVFSLDSTIDKGTEIVIEVPVQT
jgi:PAS domain S-box-containing protein